MKLITWNVNGLRACMGKGFEEFLAAQQPDGNGGQGNRARAWTPRGAC